MIKRFCMRDKTPFICNSLNRTLESSLSWAELMETIGSDIAEDAEVPFPHVEEIAAKVPLLISARMMHTRS